MTQRQANDLFNGPPVDMAQRYSNTTLLFCLTIFYTFPLPIMPFFAVAGTIFQYWLEKYLLLRRHRIPEQMGPTMAKTFSNMIPFFCFLYGMSLLIFTDILSDGDNIIGLIAFLVTIVILLFPIRSLINK